MGHFRHNGCAEQCVEKSEKKRIYNSGDENLNTSIDISFRLCVVKRNVFFNGHIRLNRRK